MLKLYTGDTFNIRCGFKASPTTPTSLAGYVITSMVKTSDGVRHPATVTIDGTKWFVRIEGGVTATWPSVGDENDPSKDAEWNCKVVKDGITVSTDKRPIRVITSPTV